MCSTLDADGMREATANGSDVQAMIAPPGAARRSARWWRPDEALAQGLIHALISSDSGFVRVDIPERAARLAAWLSSCGLAEADQGILMQRGDWSGQAHDAQGFALVSQALG